MCEYLFYAAVSHGWWVFMHIRVISSVRCCLRNLIVLRSLARGVTSHRQIIQMNQGNEEQSLSPLLSSGHSEGPACVP